MQKLFTLIIAAALSHTAAAQDPFANCAWYPSAVPDQDVAFTVFGYAGKERGIRIHHGNYDSVNDRIEYTVELMWQIGDCSGTIYALRFPNHAINNHLEISVHHQNGVMMGRLEADKGSLPRLFNESDVELATGKLGPFVIRDAMVGGANGMGETVTFTLLDAQILTQLPYPTLYDGAAPANATEEDEIADAHAAAVEEDEYVFTFFTFRRSLGGMSSADRTLAADAIDEHLYEPGPMHGDDFWEEHHHVDHGSAVGAVVAGSSFGGFFNGHRNYLGDLENDLRTQTREIPFRRVPAWDPDTDVPAEFIAGINFPTGGSDLDAAYKAANICTNYAAANSALPTLEERLAEMEETLYADVDPWHGSVHVGLGGDMAFLTTAARAPIFHPWHTTVDTIWRNWQLCDAAWHPNKYSWDAL